jgi:hypothetical protein
MAASKLQNQLNYLRHPALPGVELLVANPSSDNWRIFHERYLLCGCSSVATSWMYRRSTRVINDGTTAFMEPGEIHRVVTKQKPSHFFAVSIDRDRFIRHAEESGVSGVPHFH